jgi:hypothetical protein
VSLWPPSRRLRIALGSVGALLLLAVLATPVVFRGGGGGSCARTLRYAGRTYTARDLGDAYIVQSIAIGAGVVSGCGATPADVDVRSIARVRPAYAVALPTETSTLYVSRGRCPDLTGSPLLDCLRR